MNAPLTGAGRRLGSYLLAASALALPGAAQTIYGFDGPGASAIELTGPPAGPCAYPNGPVVSAFPTVVPFPCATAGVVPAAPFGDIAVNKRSDTVWVTDGRIFTEYTAAGAPLNSFALPIGAPGPITGMGFDSLAGVLWVTDGAFAYTLAPPPPPGCGAAPVGSIPFPLPVAAAATDIEWDSRTGSLWVCDLGGMVTNVLVGGAIGPFGFFSGTALCAFGPALYGIGVDDASPATGRLYVTDGLRIGYIDAALGGGPAPLTFYTTASCFPVPAAALAGLAFAAHGISYGVPSDNSGLVGPSIGSVGQSTSPSAAFTLTLAGSVPGATAVPFFGTSGAFCPPIPVSGVLLHVVPPICPSGGGAIVAAAGNASVATPLPPGLIGVSFWMQWVVVTPLPSLQLSDGLEFTGSAF